MNSKKTNYENKILLNIKNKKIKLNNIHYKFNVFPKKYETRTMAELEEEEASWLFPRPYDQKGSTYVSPLCDVMFMTI
jgi:hypothetical protein